MKDLGITNDEKYPAEGLASPAYNTSDKKIHYPELHLTGPQVDRLDLPADLTKTFTATVTFEISSVSTGKTGYDGKKSMDLKIVSIDDIDEQGVQDAEDEGEVDDNDEDNTEDTKPKGLAVLFKPKKIGAKAAGVI